MRANDEIIFEILRNVRKKYLEEAQVLRQERSGDNILKIDAIIFQMKEDLNQYIRVKSVYHAVKATSAQNKLIMKYCAYSISDIDKKLFDLYQVGALDLSTLNYYREGMTSYKNMYQIYSQIYNVPCKKNNFLKLIPKTLRKLSRVPSMLVDFISDIELIYDCLLNNNFNTINSIFEQNKNALDQQTKPVLD
jgi:hypothetical protein